MKNDTRFALAVAWSLFMAVFFTISFVARMPVMVAADGLLFGIGAHNVHHYWPTRARNQLDYNKIARLEQEVYGRTFTHDGAPPSDPCKVYGPSMRKETARAVRQEVTKIPECVRDHIYHPWQYRCIQAKYHVVPACQSCGSMNCTFHEDWCRANLPDPSDTYNITDGISEYY